MSGRFPVYRDAIHASMGIQPLRSPGHLAVSSLRLNEEHRLCITLFIHYRQVAQGAHRLARRLRDGAAPTSNDPSSEGTARG